MRILHYNLGFPPYRSGGLTKYSIDLAEAQESEGHEVTVLWPGKIEITGKKEIKVRKKTLKNRIESYELINPLPVSLLGGINNIEAYTKSIDKNKYINILKKINPEVIHIHTLMGIHKEFFEAARDLKIKLIFTTHDYFGLCPKVNFLYKQKICNGNAEYKNCMECNKDAHSMNKIIILQSPIYRNIKKINILSRVIKKYNSKKIAEKNLKNSESMINNCKSLNYNLLQNYYKEIFALIDFFHFNSRNTREVYESYLDDIKGKVISITHGDIKDSRRIKNFGGKLRLGYLGPATAYKGFNLLKNILDEIAESGRDDFDLSIYSNSNEISPYMKQQNGYQYKELEHIFDKMDLLIVPSLWKETFGFVVLEALSHGVPVMVSKNVGAKDLITNGENGFVVKGTKEELKKKILEVMKNREELTKINFNITKLEIKKMGVHAQEMVNLYTGEV